MKVYCISGLAADEHVFDKINFPEGFEKVCLKWKEPHKKESIEHYALRLAEDIDQSEPFILVGLSFGGMISTILTPKINPDKTILISSVTGRKELPWYFKTTGKMNLNSLLHMKTAKKAAPFAAEIFGARSKEDKQTFKQMLHESSENLMQWSINEIVKWQNQDKPSGILQIHGDKDLVLPHKYTHPDYLIKGGNHFMIMNKAEEVNKILSVILLNRTHENN